MLSDQNTYVVPKSKKEMNRVRERKGKDGGKERKRARHVPIPMTVPYSDLLSCAETAGGQRRMMARKRKKAKDSPERRREVCVLVGRDMLERGKKGKSEEKLRMMKAFIYFIKRTRRLFCHVNRYRQHFPRCHRTEHVSYCL
jgi:hypothetical protein